MSHPPAHRCHAADGSVHVTLCMIVRNEAANLAACLAPTRALFDEIIVVNTGSTDDTSEVAAQLGARVIAFPWSDDFAAARNESFRQARGDWLFWLDADDRLDDANRARLGQVFANLDGSPAAYLMQCRGATDADNLAAPLIDHIRLLRRHPDLRWERRVHEQILPAVARLGWPLRRVDVTIDHLGYRDQNVLERKRRRNLRLLELERIERPNDAQTLLHMGSVLHEMGRSAEALPLLEQALALGPTNAGILARLYARLMLLHRETGQAQCGLALCGPARRLFPEDADILFQEALLHGEMGDARREEACLLALLALAPAGAGGQPSCHDPGLRGYKAEHNLARLYFGAARLADAERYWRRAVGSQPMFALGWQGLAEICLRQQRWQEFDAIVAFLRTAETTQDAADRLAARGDMARGDYTSARRRLVQVVERRPTDVDAQGLYSQSLLLEGSDWSAAEQALRAVLALAPGNEVARRNLALLQQRQASRSRTTAVDFNVARPSR